ncbi:hypothetical protein [Sphingomonas sp. Leaf205]|uniref:hypothetical protein n=1 Tax=Sphingomonas sp. Leaf205 TaxID=2876551 RepID=UPI001E5D9741|nr:hypothetical protein [Sphingomonas sp. Leaf205]
MANAKPILTGDNTREIDRKRLPDGKTNFSASGALPDPVVQEAGIVPLKAVASITYGERKTAVPGSLFTPVSAAERQELLQGQYPPAEEPSTAELALFAEQQTEFA